MMADVRSKMEEVRRKMEDVRSNLEEVRRKMEDVRSNLELGEARCHRPLVALYL